MTDRKSNKEETKNKFISTLESWVKTVWPSLIALLRVAYALIFIGIFVFLIYLWNFDKADKIFHFLETSFWPIISLVFIFLFKDQISNLISRGIVIILPGGHEVRLNQDTPFPQTIQQPPEKKEIEKLGEDQEKLKAELINTQIYLDFERIYRIIFGSQIDLLKRLRLSPSGESSRDTIFFFALNQRIFPVFVNWTFDQYLSFLLSNNLIFSSSGRYFITGKGRDFLAYIELLNLPNKGL